MAKDDNKYKGVDFRKHNDRLCGRDLPIISPGAAKIIIDSGQYQKVKSLFYISLYLPLTSKS